MVGSTVNFITRCGGETKPTFPQIDKDPLARHSNSFNSVTYEILEACTRFVVQELDTRGKSRVIVCAQEIASEKEEEIADVYSDLKIGQNLVSLVVTLKDCIPTREVAMNFSHCEAVGIPKEQIASGRPKG